MKKYFFLLTTILFFFSFLGITYAQTVIKAPVLDSVSKNNEGVKMFEGNRIYAVNGDAIRVSGPLKKGEVVKVYFNEKEYIAVNDQLNNWFVLFSVTNLTEDEYAVEAMAETKVGKSEKVELLTLVIGDEPIGEEDEEVVKEKNDFDFKNIVIIILSITLVVLLWIILSPKILDKKKK